MSLLAVVESGLVLNSETNEVRFGPGYLLSNQEEFQKCLVSDIDRADLLKEEKLERIIFSSWAGFTYSRLTYKGRRILYEEQDKDLVGWRQLWKKLDSSVICCDRVIPGPFCVCRVTTICDVHGGGCHGSHD